MVIENEKYKIGISRDCTFTLDSTDNKPYGLILNPDNLKRSSYYTGLSITINDSNGTRQVILVGYIWGADDDIAVLVDNNLFILMNAMLVGVDCNTLAIMLHKNLPDFGTYFSIHKFEDGYIVYGEQAILKLTSDFEVEWTFMGADIFVSLDGSIPFHIENDVIFLTDWNGTKYKVDKRGKVVLLGTK